MEPAQKESETTMKTILVIDDQPNIRTLLKFDTKDKFHVVTVHNNMEALQWLRADHKPDLIVSDGTMPYLGPFWVPQNHGEADR